MARRRRRQKRRLIPRRWLVRLFGVKRDYPRRVRRAIAIGITVASALAATAAWRAEDRSRVAEEQDRAGFAQDVALGEQKASIRANVLLRSVQRYARLTSANALADALRSEARTLTQHAEAADRNGQAERAATLRADADRLTVQADAQTALASNLVSLIDADAYQGGKMTFDTLRQTLSRELRFSGTEVDVISNDEFARSNRNFDKSNTAVVIALIALLAAFALTLAQITARPRAVVLCIVLAIAAFGGAAAWLIQLEVT